MPELWKKFDDWSPAGFRLSDSKIESAIAQVSERIEDIEFAQVNVRRFVQIQKEPLDLSKCSGVQA